MNPEIPVPGNTPIAHKPNLFGVANLYIKDETQNPTHTFKDRLAYEMVRPTLEAIQNNREHKKITFSSISYGNTAFSMGYYAQKINELAGQEVVKAVAFVPPTLKDKTFGPDSENKQVSGKEVINKIAETCQIIDIDLKKQIYRSNDLEEIAKEHNVVLDEFIDITEGLDRPAYVNIIIEAVEQQLKFVPDYVIVPFGAGILCNEIIDYVKDNNLKTKVIPVSSGDPDTIGIMLYGPIWVDTESLLRDGKGMTRHDLPDKKGRTRDQYLVYHVTDDEMRSAMTEMKAAGMIAEASGASSCAIISRLKEIDPGFNPDTHTVLAINTGDGLLNF